MAEKCQQGKRHKRAPQSVAREIVKRENERHKAPHKAKRRGKK